MDELETQPMQITPPEGTTHPSMEMPKVALEKVDDETKTQTASVATIKTADATSEISQSETALVLKDVDDTDFWFSRLQQNKILTVSTLPVNSKQIPTESNQFVRWVKDRVSQASSSGTVIEEIRPPSVQTLSIFIDQLISIVQFCNTALLSDINANLEHNPQFKAKMETTNQLYEFLRNEGLINDATFILTYFFSIPHNNIDQSLLNEYFDSSERENTTEKVTQEMKQVSTEFAPRSRADWIKLIDKNTFLNPKGQENPAIAIPPETPDEWMNWYLSFYKKVEDLYKIQKKESAKAFFDGAHQPELAFDELEYLTDLAISLIEFYSAVKNCDELKYVSSYKKALESPSNFFLQGVMAFGEIHKTFTKLQGTELSVDADFLIDAFFLCSPEFFAFKNFYDFIKENSES